MYYKQDLVLTAFVSLDVRCAKNNTVFSHVILTVPLCMGGTILLMVQNTP